MTTSAEQIRAALARSVGWKDLHELLTVPKSAGNFAGLESFALFFLLEPSTGVTHQLYSKDR